MWTPSPWPGRKKIEPNLLACLCVVESVQVTGSETRSVIEPAQVQRKRKAEWHSEPQTHSAEVIPAKKVTTVSANTGGLCQRLASNAIHLYTVVGETNTAVRRCLQSTDATFYCDGYAEQARSWRQSQLSTLVPSTVRTGNARTQYDKAFCCEWINNRHVAVSTKCGRILRVDRYKRSYQEIALEGSRWVEPPIITDEDLHIHRVNRGGIHCVRANPAKTMLACSGGHGEDHNVFVLDLQKEKWAAIHKGAGHRDWVFTLSWLSDTVFATGSRDHTIKLWSPTASQAYCMQPLVEYKNHNAKVRCCAFDGYTDRFASMDVLGNVFLWDPAGQGRTMSVLRKFQLEPEYREECTCMLLGQNMLVVGAREHVTIYDPRRPASVLSTPLGKIAYDDEEEGAHALAARSISKQGPLLGIGLSTGGSVMFCDIRKFTSKLPDQQTPSPAPLQPDAASAAAALNSCCSPQPSLPAFVVSQARKQLLCSRSYRQGVIHSTDMASRKYNLRQRCKIKVPARFVAPKAGPDSVPRPSLQDISLPFSCTTLDLSKSVVNHGVLGQLEGDIHFDDVVQSGLAVDNAVFSHNWSPDGRTMFTCGGPLAMGMRGCCLSFWD